MSGLTLAAWLASAAFAAPTAPRVSTGSARGAGVLAPAPRPVLQNSAPPRRAAVPKTPGVSTSTAPARGAAAKKSAVSLPADASGEKGVSTDERRRALMLTDLLMDDNRLDEAEVLVKQGLELDVETGEWTLRLGRIRTAQRRYKEAADLYESLLASRIDDAGLLLQLGQLSFSAGDLARAKRSFLKARDLLKEPLAPYYLAELAYAGGEDGEGRRWAEESLKELEDATDSSLRRMSLHLRARLRWRDSLNEEYGRLFDSFPHEMDTPSEWAGSLIRAGYTQDAVEPMELLRERFPKGERRWTLLEADRLRADGRERELRSHLEESVRRFPNEPALQLSLGELYARDHWWLEAEPLLTFASRTEEYERVALELMTESRRTGHTRAGPAVKLHDSQSTRSIETGATFSTYPRRGLRLEAEASRGETHIKSRDVRQSLAGFQTRLFRETAPLTTGVDFEVRTGAGQTAASPGVSAAWRPADSVVLEAAGAFRRAWSDSPEAVAAGALTHEGSFTVQGRPFRKLVAVLGTRLNRATVRGGGDATQTVITPEATLTLLDAPFHIGLGYRYVILDASGDDQFFAKLPLVQRARPQYGVLSFGRSWLLNRVRADGYVYNGHEPARGRSFARGDLVGIGGNFEWLVGSWRLLAGFEHTREDTAGVGGRTQSFRLGTQWIW